MRQTNTDRRQNRRKWPWILGGIAAVALVAAAALRGRTSAAGTGGIRTATAQRGSMSITVVGTGNLEYDDAEDIKVPTGIIVDEVLVESGDAVKAGDVLATFDPLSIRQEIESVKSSIESLDRRIQYAKDAPETKTVKANVEGRVKAVYAEKGDDALNVYSEHGALVVLSIDGKMAVDFPSNAGLSAGDEVKVVLSDGAVKTGAVEKVENGTVTVTLTDNGPRLGEPVTVQSSDGTSLGTGTLYIHRPIRVAATEGKVKTVHVSENDKVSAGKTLVTLEGFSEPLEKEQLLADREDLMEKLDSLVKLSRTGSLVAESDGVIQTVNLTEGKAVGGASASLSASPSGSTASAPAPASSNGSSYGGAAGASGALPSAMMGGYAAASAPAAQGYAPSSQSAPAAGPSSGSSDEHMAVAFTVAPADSVLLSVKVDELDILSIEKGMQAEIAFDAIPNSTFTGEIFEISDAATSTGSVAKFTVKIRVKKDEQMRVGISATATILVEEKKNVLLLPIAALQESSGRVYVYTALDPETGALSGEVSVVTGSSDGEYAEILSGLSEGDEVYYKAASGDLLTEFGPARFFRRAGSQE